MKSQASIIIKILMISLCGCMLNSCANQKDATGLLEGLIMSDQVKIEGTWTVEHGEAASIAIPSMDTSKIPKVKVTTVRLEGIVENLSAKQIQELNFEILLSAKGKKPYRRMPIQLKKNISPNAKEEFVINYIIDKGHLPIKQVSIVKEEKAKEASSN